MEIPQRHTVQAFGEPLDLLRGQLAQERQVVGAHLRLVQRELDEEPAERLLLGCRGFVVPTEPDDRIGFGAMITVPAGPMTAVVPPKVKVSATATSPESAAACLSSTIDSGGITGE
ncbi:hypothetical protein ADL00_05035 [Streptomyces sp. AS58]|uniref:hypothetical protein n=1 Tax=Streptomyces sp. AS58 TaxID=1519489 RepID=UPI0006AF2203|nr:hypothetical protein [Streptomyces sp. AS58]KOV72866.1 hypothetical protein ADL00_05035 [Streptomyces sp. AS58]